MASERDPARLQRLSHVALIRLIAALAKVPGQTVIPAISFVGSATGSNGTSVPAFSGGHSSRIFIPTNYR